MCINTCMHICKLLTTWHVHLLKIAYINTHILTVDACTKILHSSMHACMLLSYFFCSCNTQHISMYATMSYLACGNICTTVNISAYTLVTHTYIFACVHTYIFIRTTHAGGISIWRSKKLLHVYLKINKKKNSPKQK